MAHAAAKEIFRPLWKVWGHTPPENFENELSQNAVIVFPAVFDHILKYT